MKNTDKKIHSNIQYYSIFTPSILHDALISKIIDKYINDNNNSNTHDDVSSIKTISDSSYLSEETHDRSNINIKPFVHSLNGVLVSIDISQFTKLSVTLEIEQVEHVINEVFGVLISIVYCFGGDVIKFAGDAFHVFWKFGENDKAEVCMMTAECCVKLREIFVKVISPKYDSIGIRICSEAGKPLRGVIKADALTVKGDYVICSFLYSYIEKNLIASNVFLEFISNDTVKCYKFPKDCSTLFNSILSEDDVYQLLNVRRDSMLLSKICDEISSRNCRVNNLFIENELSRQLGYYVHELARNPSKDKELKNSCILFIRLAADIDQASDKIQAFNLQQYIFTILSLLCDFEAKLRQYIIDDKGLICIVSVSSSKTSWMKHVSIAEIAIDTALAIQTELKRKFSLQTVIGISEGKCYFGNIGWLDSRVEYSIMGPTVNLSARLMSVGRSGDIICDKEVYRNAYSSRSQTASFSKNSDLILKGFSDPVENYKVASKAQDLHNDDIINKERFAEAVKVLTSGLVISEQQIIKIAEFLFSPFVKNTNIEFGYIAVYFLNIMQSIDASTCINPNFCIVEDNNGEGISCFIESLYEVLSSVVNSFDLKNVKMIKSSCATHDKVFVVIIKKYINQWLKSTSLSLNDLKIRLQLSSEASTMIDIILNSYLSLPSKQQVDGFCEIFEKISAVYDELLVIFIDQTLYLDSISVDIFKALSGRDLKIQFVISHDSSHDAVDFNVLLSSLRLEKQLRISSVVCTKSDVSIYLKGCFDSNGLSIPITSTCIDLIIDCTKGIPSLIIQLIDSCVHSFIRKGSGSTSPLRKTVSYLSLTCKSLSTASLASLTSSERDAVTKCTTFEEEIMLFAKLDDLTNYKYDTLTLDNQKVCKLAAVLATKDIFKFKTLYDLIATYFSDLLDFESSSRPLKGFNCDGKDISTSMENLLFQLLDTKFFKVYDDVTSEHDLFLKFNLTREKDIIYNFMTRDIKQQYHTNAAKILLQVANATANPIPALIYEIGLHFSLGNDLWNAILCYYRKGEFLYSFGANKDALIIFEQAFDICCAMFRDALHDDLSNSHPHEEAIGDIHDWSMFSRYSLQDMYTVCRGSNVILYTLLSVIIRYGQCLINCSQRRKAMSIFPLAIQLFVSSKADQTSNDVNDSSTLHCKSSTEIMHFIKDTNFLIKDSQMNIDKGALNQVQQFGIFSEQFETIFPIISGFLTAVLEPGYHIQQRKELEIHFQTLEGMLKICEKGHSHTHCIRFFNLKLWYIVQFNSPDMFHRCLTLAELSFSMYNYDEHSNALITLYGSDRGLETIAIGAVYNIMTGNFKKAFQYLECVVSLLPKVTHFFSNMIVSQKLGLALMLMSDFKVAVTVFKELRFKEINAPFSIFVNVNIVLFEYLIQTLELEGKDVPQDIDTVRLDPRKLESILNGSSSRNLTLPLEAGYRLMELVSGIGLENVLGNICLTIALKIMKGTSIGLLTDVEKDIAKAKIISFCNVGLKYIGTYLKEGNNDEISSGYMAVKIQALWCKARLYHVLLLLSTDNDEKALYKEKIKNSIGTADNIINVFFDGINDSYMKLINDFWKLKLDDDKDVYDYFVKRYTCILQDIEDVETLYESSSISDILQRFKSHINDFIQFNQIQ